MSLAIEAHALGKCYRLQPRASHIRELLRSRAGGRASEAFWALRDLSFSARPGEVIGVLGHNGSGKSTLLKLLSGVVPPSEGEARMRGRLCSLLELGAGLHPDLSGRENLFVYGAMLGMDRREIHRKLDVIVAFAGIDRFLDAPLRVYSSGMRLRLAFAVAAHLDPQILLIDEALAVGDAAFREKALARIKALVAGGACVLLVSHEESQILSLCRRALLLQAGRLVHDGSVPDALDHLHRSLGTVAVDGTTLEQVSLCPVGSDGALRVDSTWTLQRPLALARMGVVIRVGQRRLASGWLVLRDLPAGHQRLAVELAGIRLNPGEYGLELALADADRLLLRQTQVARLRIPADAAERPLPGVDDSPSVRLQLLRLPG